VKIGTGGGAHFTYGRHITFRPCVVQPYDISRVNNALVRSLWLVGEYSFEILLRNYEIDRSWTVKV